MQLFPDFSKFDTAILPVIGMLAAAGTAKLGYGQWAAGGAALFIAMKLGAAATAVLTRQLSAWVTRLETQQQRALVRVRSSRDPVAPMKSRWFRGTVASAYGEE